MSAVQTPATNHLRWRGFTFASIWPLNSAQTELVHARHGGSIFVYLLSIRPKIALDNGNVSVTIAHGRGSGVPGSERM